MCTASRRLGRRWGDAPQPRLVAWGARFLSVFLCEAPFIRLKGLGPEVSGSAVAVVGGFRAGGVHPWFWRGHVCVSRRGHGALFAFSLDPQNMNLRMHWDQPIHGSPRMAPPNPPGGALIPRSPRNGTPPPPYGSRVSSYRLYGLPMARVCPRTVCMLAGVCVCVFVCLLCVTRTTWRLHVSTHLDTAARHRRHRRRPLSAASSFPLHRRLPLPIAP